MAGTEISTPQLLTESVILRIIPLAFLSARFRFARIDLGSQFQSVKDSEACPDHHGTQTADRSKCFRSKITQNRLKPKLATFNHDHQLYVAFVILSERQAARRQCLTAL